MRRAQTVLCRLIATSVSSAPWLSVQPAFDYANVLITLARPFTIAHIMDKKAQKKIDVLRQRLAKMRQQLAGAKSQMDDPDEVRRLESDIAKAEAEIEKLRAS